MGLSAKRRIGRSAVPEKENSRRLRHLLLVAAEGVVFVYVILDGLATPIIRPLLRWMARLRLVLRMQEIVAALPPYAILALLGVPLAVAEPAKIYALVLMGAGHFLTGFITMALAYFVSLVVAERIYHAGEAKLRTIPWFAKLIDWLTRTRGLFLAWARATRLWAFATKLQQTTRLRVAKLLLYLRNG